MLGQGRYPPRPRASDITGLGIAGVVEAVSGEGRWRTGDAVGALVTGGGYAEYCAAPLAQCLPVPAGLGMVEAASLPETFFTVWTNVFDRAALAPGETLLVQGGTSGIGVPAIQMTGGEAGLIAQVLPARAAERAVTAGPAKPGYAHSLAGVKSRHSSSQRLDEADDLMPGNQGYFGMR